MSYKPKNIDYSSMNTGGTAPQVPPSQTPMPSQSGRFTAVNPSQSGGIPPVSPSQSGNFAAVTPQQDIHPGQTQLPVLPEYHDPRYAAAHAAMQSERRTRRRNKGLIVGLIACGVLLIAALLFLFAYIFKPFGLFEERIDVSAPTQFQVQEAFEGSDIPYPNVSHFKFVNTNNLRMASIGQYESGDVEYGRANGKQTATSEGRAIAHYRNGFVDVDQQLAVKMTYDVDNETWIAGTPIEESSTVTPTELPDVEAITSDFPEILKSYDSKLAEMYEGAEITAESDVSLDGGTIAFTLTKTKDDASTITCVAETTVTWDQGSGWDVAITTVSGDVATPEEEAAAEEQQQSTEETSQEPVQPEPTPEPTPPANNNSNGGGGSSGGNDYGGATLSLVCYTGDLVEITGTVQFDPSGRVLLKTDQRIAVFLDSRSYITDYFELTGPNFTNGQHTSIIGYISAAGKLPQAPLMLDTNI